MNPDDAMSTHQALVSLSDDPEAWRRAPFSDIIGQCYRAKYGDDGDELPILTTPF